MGKIRILFINASQGIVNRGAETFVKEVSKRLEEYFEVGILTALKLPPRWPILWRFYIDYQGLFVFLFTLKNLPYIWKEKFDVIIPLNGGWQAFLIRLVTWIYGGKVIITGQSGKGWDDRINLLTFPDIFVSLSSSLKVWARKLNPLVNVKYIPNGVDVLKFKPGGENIKCNLSKPVILCVGALTDEKRVHLAINAVARLQNCSLLIVGDGPLKEELSMLGKKLLGDRFLIANFSFEQMPDVYRCADVFTIPSPGFRSFEIVICEAMATNLPVVVNNDPIRKEIVGDAGLLIDPTDIDEYSKALKDALSKDWKLVPRRQSEQFSWDTISEKYTKLISEVATR